ncbi:MAG: zinc-ribbon domain-containing protein [Proteobacteria bacterium]|nr:zinc-ribbon domain-containing protein [Pseudomonadota bacterium]
MIVSCPSCEERYKFSEEKLGKRGAKITCPKCRHVFVVYKDRETESLGRKSADGTITADERATAQPAPPRNPWPRDFPTWSFRELGATWRVRKLQGMTYEFYSLEELNGFLEERQVSRSDQISIDGRDWHAIEDFSNLTAYFYDTWKRVESGEIQLDDEEDEEDEADAPTTIMGAASSLADEIRRAVQDARTPAPSPSRVSATPASATPRTSSPRETSPDQTGDHAGFVTPPPAQPSWGGPMDEPEPTSKARSWSPPPREPSPAPAPAAPVVPPRPERAPTTGGPSSFGNAKRGYGSNVPLPDASAPISAPPPGIHDPFTAMAQDGPPAPAFSETVAPEPPPKKEARASGGGGGLVGMAMGLLVLLVLAIAGGVAGLKLGVIPADVVPVDLPAVLLPTDAAEAGPEGQAAPEGDEGTEAAPETEEAPAFAQPVPVKPAPVKPAPAPVPFAVPKPKPVEAPKPEAKPAPAPFVVPAKPAPVAEPEPEERPAFVVPPKPAPAPEPEPSGVIELPQPEEAP